MQMLGSLSFWKAELNIMFHILVIPVESRNHFQGTSSRYQKATYPAPPENTIMILQRLCTAMYPKKQCNE